jgi:hypothetical protein
MSCSEIITKVATIPNGTALSGAVDIERAQSMALWFPAAWTAANVTLQFAQVETPDTADWFDFYDLVGEVTLPAAASRVVVFTGGLLLPGITRVPQTNSAIAKMRIRSGTAASPVNQDAERLIRVSLWRLE